MSALRLARGVTKRDLLLKFEGNYHGHSGQLSFAIGLGAGYAGHRGMSGSSAGAGVR